MSVQLQLLDAILDQGTRPERVVEVPDDAFGVLDLRLAGRISAGPRFGGRAVRAVPSWLRRNIDACEIDETEIQRHLAAFVARLDLNQKLRRQVDRRLNGRDRNQAPAVTRGKLERGLKRKTAALSDWPHGER